MAKEGIKRSIRFAGFADEWQHRKLKEISDKVTEKNTSLTYSCTFTNSAEFGVIRQRDYFDHDISNKDNIGGYYVVKSDDFVYNPRISSLAPVGPINRNRLGETGVMSPLYSVFRTHDVDNSYLEQYFKSRHWHSFMLFNGDTGARSDRFSIKDWVFTDMPIPYPSIPEQEKVAGFLENIDKLIIRKQQKYEKLQNLKSAMLEKMFPKDGADEPEIRFKGFTEPWELRPLGEVTQITMGQSPYGENYTDNPSDSVLVQGNADIKNGIVVPRVWTTQITKTTKAGGLIITVRAPVGEVGKTDYNVVLGRGVAGINGNEFIFQALKRMKKTNYWKKYSAGSTFDSINSDDLSTAIISMAEDREQNQIGAFFEQLDNLITLHECELEKLKCIKKAMLERMFV